MSEWSSSLPSQASDAVRRLIATEAGISPSKLGVSKAPTPSQMPPSAPLLPSVPNIQFPLQPHSRQGNTGKDTGNKKRIRAPYGKYGGRYCSVVGCSNNQGRDVTRGVMFHKFPRDKERHHAWVQAVRRTDVSTSRIWQPGPFDVICSEHFYGGKKSDVYGNPSYNPTIFPTHHIQPKSIQDEARFKRQQRFQEARERSASNNLVSKSGPSNTHGPFANNFTSFTCSSETYPPDSVLTMGKTSSATGSPSACSTTMSSTCSSSSATCSALPSTATSDELTFDELLLPSHTSNLITATTTMSATEQYVSNNSVEKDTFRIYLPCGIQANFPATDDEVFCFEVDCVSNTEKATMFRCGKQSVKSKTKGIQVGSKAESNSLPFIYFNDRQFRAFCGVDRNFAAFLLSQVGNRLRDGRILKREGKIFLMLTKLKLNTNFSVLGAMYGISDCQASIAFRDTLASVYEVVKDFIIWFDRRVVKARMPPSFKALYPETRAIIDCSEIETEQIQGLRQQVLMYSNYKGRFTYKFLVAISPSGEIMFISKGYGGRTTDTHITVDSGFLNLIEEGDVILGDKGFPSIDAKVTEKGGILVMPPFKKNGRQFSNSENKEGYQCASIRVHVERAIRRMKYFKIMKFISHDMLHLMDLVTVVIAFITNCFPDLIKNNGDEDDDISELSTLTEQISVEV